MPEFCTVIHQTHLQVQSTFRGLLQLPGTAVPLGFVLKFIFTWHLQCNTEIPWNKNWQRGKNCCCLQLCLQGPAGQEVLFSWECLVKMIDFYINSLGHKFIANSERAFKPKQLLVAQIIFNNSSVLCTLFLLHFFEYFWFTLANYYKLWSLLVTTSCKLKTKLKSHPIKLW